MNLNYLRKKTATIQNPAIRYFATFLANSIFGKGDTGAMASPEMCVIYSALYPNMVHKVNAAWEQQDDQVGDDDQQWGNHGWDDYGQAQQYQQYQQPPQQPYMQPQPGYDYVPMEEYDTLVAHVGDMESTLQDVNTNVLYLTQSFSEFITNFQTYYPPPHGGNCGQ
ncbi:hypothetical protein QYE76_049701 [Lolium multiflorum]|uniref:Arabidopsis retrotransposon Orf1 C-terminal domain-containing protein n=1 Tax=Lolium multiflorum TaxID=4521 RepID=A0AAD8SNI3_LOLMU|nr:hypothetical protein QYE76_049701 [Lolium multiflorum]